jgi:tRNA 2-selenouridine synthase
VLAPAENTSEIDEMQWISPQHLRLHMLQRRIVDLRPTAHFRKGAIPFSMNIPADMSNVLEPLTAAQIARIGRNMRKEACLLLGDHPEAQVAVATQLAQHGLEAHCLHGGYAGFQSYRDAHLAMPRRWLRVAGLTGAGKTAVLRALKQRANCAVLDLESAAQHNGSAFGALGKSAQPSQEAFVNTIWLQIKDCDAQTLWVEDEGRMIGKAVIPTTIWDAMKAAPVVMLHVPFEVRLTRTVRMYGAFPIAELQTATQSMARKLGAAPTHKVLRLLGEHNITDAFAILLTHYDRAYAKRMAHFREFEAIDISWDGEDMDALIAQILAIGQQLEAGNS